MKGYSIQLLLLLYYVEITNICTPPVLCPKIQKVKTLHMLCRYTVLIDYIDVDYGCIMIQISHWGIGSKLMQRNVGASKI